MFNLTQTPNSINILVAALFTYYITTNIFYIKHVFVLSFAVAEGIPYQKTSQEFITLAGTVLV